MDSAALPDRVLLLKQLSPTLRHISAMVVGAASRRLRIAKSSQNLFGAQKLAKPSLFASPNDELLLLMNEWTMRRSRTPSYHCGLTVRWVGYVLTR